MSKKELAEMHLTAPDTTENSSSKPQDKMDSTDKPMSNRNDDDTKNTFEQFELIYNKYKHMCSEGQINKETFSTLLREIFSEYTTNLAIDRYFAILDKENKGYIDLREFLSAMTILLKGSIEQKIKFIFLVFDLKGDHSITKEELATWMRAAFLTGREINEELIEHLKLKHKFQPTSQLTNKDIDDIVEACFAIADTDNDGRISEKEFTNWLLKQPKMINYLSPTTSSVGEHAKRQCTQDDANDEIMEMARVRRKRLSEVRRRKHEHYKTIQEEAKKEKETKMDRNEYPQNLMNNFVLIASSRTIGRRQDMEDADVILFNYRGKENEIFAGVFDGHGGYEAATCTSKILPEVFAEKLHTYYNKYKQKKVKDNNLVRRLNEYLQFLSKKSGKKIEDSHESIQLSQLPEPHIILTLLRESFLHTSEILKEKEIFSGTTAAVVYYAPPKFYVANVGDTRIVLCRNGRATRLTVDHKPSDESEAIRITQVGGFIANNRVNGLLGVSRSIGDSAFEPMVIADPFTQVIEITPQDEFAIIACDGVWDVLTDDDAVNLIRHEMDPRFAAMQLRDYAFEKGSNDNISVVVLRFLNK